MIAFYASLLVTLILTGIAVVRRHEATQGQAPHVGRGVRRRRPRVDDLPALSYAIVPHQFITMCDKDFGWRSDIFGIPTGPALRLPGPWHGQHLLWANGVTFMGRGRLLINQQTVRDIIVTNIYVRVHDHPVQAVGHRPEPWPEERRSRACFALRSSAGAEGLRSHGSYRRKPAASRFLGGLHPS